MKSSRGTRAPLPTRVATTRVACPLKRNPQGAGERARRPRSNPDSTPRGRVTFHQDTRNLLLSGVVRAHRLGLRGRDPLKALMPGLRPPSEGPPAQESQCRLFRAPALWAGPSLGPTCLTQPPSSTTKDKVLNIKTCSHVQTPPQKSGHRVPTAQIQMAPNTWKKENSAEP